MSSVALFTAYSSKAGRRRDTWPDYLRSRKVSPVTPALVMAAMLAAGPAAAGAPAATSADGAPAVALSADNCFDRVAVILNNKPQPSPGSASPEAPALDVHPVLILSMNQPRPCTAYKAIGDMSPSRPVMWAPGPEDPSAPASVTGQGWLGVETPSAAPPPFAPRLPLSGPLADAVLPDAPPTGGFTVSAGFVLPDGLLRGRASGAGSGGLATAASAASGGGGPASGLGPTAGPLAANPSKTPDLIDPPAGAPGIAGPSGVPEPATWLMLVAGLFGLGAALRQRPHRLAA
jgi:hypothetical protein